MNENVQIYCRFHKKRHRGPECLKPEPSPEEKRAERLRQQRQTVADSRGALRHLLRKSEKLRLAGKKIPGDLKREVNNLERCLRIELRTLERLEG